MLAPEPKLYAISGERVLRTVLAQAPIGALRSVPLSRLDQVDKGEPVVSGASERTWT